MAVRMLAKDYLDMRINTIHHNLGIVAEYLRPASTYKLSIRATSSWGKQLFYAEGVISEVMEEIMAGHVRGNLNDRTISDSLRALEGLAENTTVMERLTDDVSGSLRTAAIYLEELAKGVQLEESRKTVSLEELYKTGMKKMILIDSLNPHLAQKG